MSDKPDLIFLPRLGAFKVGYKLSNFFDDHQATRHESS